MYHSWCIACGSGLSIRAVEGPRRVYSCNRCIASRGVALECSDCGHRWHGRRETDVCKRCLESKLAEKGIWPGRWKDPI